MTTWVIWKSKIKNSINNQDITTQETTQTLKGQISDLVRKSWNTMHFMTEEMKANRQSDLHKLWAEGSLTNFGPKSGPIVNFT